MTDRKIVSNRSFWDTCLSTAANAIGVSVDGRVSTAARAAQDEVLFIDGVISHVVTHVSKESKRYQIKKGKGGRRSAWVFRSKFCEKNQ